jgi:hypothetical protein
MPAEQPGLLAEAVKFTGDPSCEPLAGDLTVTTGVVAIAKWVSMASPKPSIGLTEKRRIFMGRRPRKWKNLSGGI